MPFAIQARNVGKQYRIGARQAGGLNLRETLVHAAAAPFHRLRRRSNGSAGADTNDEERADNFWALRDVSFDIQPGEVVGVIGRNGAGKSTLLKVLSRITEPTTGRVELTGRVASLLEVGTGFHPELTGRENIYLNGAILGMKRREIARKFDDIVAFSEIERFLETPVKRYSSGMYVRLAFSVAAHLEPEILIVDEVLAVGDAEFQKKCLGKMQSVGATGRTVLFVSHNLEAVEAMCQRALWIDRGEVQADGNPTSIIKRYLHGSASRQARQDWRTDEADEPYLIDFQFLDEAREPVRFLPMLSPSRLDFRFHLPEPIRDFHFVLRLLGDDGSLKTSVTSRESACAAMGDEGEYRVSVHLPELACLPGVYHWSLEFYRPSQRPALRRIDRLWDFEVLRRILDGASHAYVGGPSGHGVFHLNNEILISRDCDRDPSDSDRLDVQSHIVVGPSSAR